MKRLLLTLMIGITIQGYSQTLKEITSEIKNVTVYRQGAQISRESNTIISKGKSTLILKGLPSKIIPSSIQVSSTNNVMIVSVTHNLDYLNKRTIDKELISLNGKQRSLVDSIKILNNLKTVYSQEKEMILSNKSIAGDNGVNINELEQAATFFRKRLTEIETANYKMDNSLYLLKNDLVSVSKQLLELNSKIDLPTSLIKVVVSSDLETKSNISISYFVPDASWDPTYDIRIKEANEPLILFYKAKVSQNTDEDWDNVKLTLSTGNPSISNNKPDLSTYYLTFDNYYKSRPNDLLTQNQPFKGKVTGKITDAETGEPLPGTTVLVKGTTFGTITDMNGNYSIELPQGNNALVVSYIGFGQQELIADKANINIAMKQEQLKLDEVVVVGYGVSGDESESLSGRASGVTVVKKKEQIPMAIEKRQITTEFQINIPYTIPSDNQFYDVNMVEYEINSQYSYYAVPKLSCNAFLIAKIPDWIKYNLLSGNAYIFFKGIYQGVSYMDLETSSDTLSISVGRDKDIVISRDIQKDYQNKNISGITKKEQKAWTISVKNNKYIPIDISVEDQYPISKTDDIKVDLIESSGAKIEKSTGKLIWDINLTPSEKKTINLIYSVKYPTSRSIIVE
jgi:hypothetical protein